MLLSLGLGSQIGIMEGMLCTIFDIDFFKRFSKPVLTGKSDLLLYVTEVIDIVREQKITRSCALQNTDLALHYNK